MVFGSRSISGPRRCITSGTAWQIKPDAAFRCDDKSKADRHGDLLQSVRKEVLQGINLRSNRFGFEPEITAKISKGKWRIYEVPISYAGAHTKKARIARGKTACKRCGAFFGTRLRISDSSLCSSCKSRKPGEKFPGRHFRN